MPLSRLSRVRGGFRAVDRSSRSSNSGKGASAGCELFPWRQALLPLPSGGRKKKKVPLSGAVERGRAKAQPTGPFPLPFLPLFPNLTMHLPYIISICSIFQPGTRPCRPPHHVPRPRPILPGAFAFPTQHKNTSNLSPSWKSRGKPGGCEVYIRGAVSVQIGKLSGFLSYHSVFISTQLMAELLMDLRFIHLHL